VVFANQFMGNHEIYHVYRKDGSWSLPVNVSHTTGFSAEPTLVITADDTLHAAWMDNTPGYWTIYFGTWHEEVWSSEPVPNGRGQIPALTAGRNGALYLAWQDRIPTAGVLDIFLSEFVGGNWSLPVNISNRPTVDSIGASLTTANDGFVHLTWIDAGNEVRYSYGRSNGWSLPQTISSASAVANAPHILAEDDGWLDVAWDEGEIIRATGKPVGTSSWSKPEVITVPIANLKDVTLAAIPVGGVTLGWAQSSSGNAGIYMAWRGSAFSWHLWLPVALR
jgi:hypothetical protein